MKLQKKKWNLLFYFIFFSNMMIGADEYFRFIRIWDRETNSAFPSNYISTTRYTILSFIPLSLFEQFRKFSNLYFLFIAILSFAPFSPVAAFTSYSPLLFVIFVSSAKSAYENWLRYQADKKANSIPIEWIDPDSFESKIIQSQEIVVGDLLLIHRNQTIPCDCIVIKSSNPFGISCIETSNLDGETNVKRRHAVCQNTEIPDINGLVKCHEPNEHLYFFEGELDIDGEKQPLRIKNFLPRGSTLKSTLNTYVLAVYTGVDTKMSLNNTGSKFKFSKFEKVMNFIVAAMFIFQLICVAILAVMGVKEFHSSKDSDLYLFLEDTTTLDAVLIGIITNIIILSYTIPMSLFVTLESVRFFQALYMMKDNDFVTDLGSLVVRNSNLNEELSQISRIFTDKTGTLTENDMIFQKCSCNGKIFKIENGENPPAEFLRYLCLCNSIEREENGGIHSESPDEVALVIGCAKIGFIFETRQGNSVLLTEYYETRDYEIVATIEFSSQRKMMSVIVIMDDIPMIITKGADSIILNLIDPYHDKELLEITKNHIDQFAEEGLRTLLIGFRYLDRFELIEWLPRFEAASSGLEDMISVSKMIERDFTIAGGTGVMDRLQRGVPDTIDFFIKAGVKIWLLTGDKTQTAISVSRQAKIIKNEFFLIEGTISEEIIQSYKEMGDPTNYSVVITGPALRYLLRDLNPNTVMMNIDKANSVVCCRMDPVQKARVVEIVQQNSNDITLAVGDGANDVSMILEASVGVGVLGREGTQASRCADFSITRFHHLKKLISVYGRYSNNRLRIIALYFFYKNLLFVMPQLLYSIYSGFSGVSLYPEWYLTLYNVLPTAFAPVVFGVLEYDCLEDSLLYYPQLLWSHRKEKFSWKNLVPRAISSLIQGTFIYYIMHYSLQANFVDIYGKEHGSLSFGTLMGTIISSVAINDLAIRTQYWGFPMFAAVIVQYASIFLIFIPLSYDLYNSWDMYNVFPSLFWETPSFHFLLIILIGFCTLSSTAILYLKRNYFPKDWQIIHYNEKEYNFDIDNDDLIELNDFTGQETNSSESSFESSI